MARVRTRGARIESCSSSRTNENFGPLFRRAGARMGKEFYSSQFKVGSREQSRRGIRSRFEIGREETNSEGRLANCGCNGTGYWPNVAFLPPRDLDKYLTIRKMVGRGGGDRTRKTFEFSMTHDIHGEIGRLWSWC